MLSHMNSMLLCLLLKSSLHDMKNKFKGIVKIKYIMFFLKTLKVGFVCFLSIFLALLLPLLQISNILATLEVSP